MPQAIREMPLWPDAPFSHQIPKGLTVRRGIDASGRNLVVVCNQAHKAYSLPLDKLESDGARLPQFFLERISGL